MSKEGKGVLTDPAKGTVALVTSARSGIGRSCATSRRPVMSRLPPGTPGKGYGKPDCAHNNAGIAGLTSSTVGYAEADRDTIITIGLEGVSPCTKSEIP